MCLYLCKGYSINWKIQPILSVRAITLQRSSFQCFIKLAVCLETQAVAVTSMQFSACLHLVIVFSDTSSIFFYLPEGGCMEKSQPWVQSQGRERGREKESAKGDMLAACSNQSSNHLNNTLTSHPLPKRQLSYAPGCLDLFKETKIQNEHSPRKASIWH